MARKHKTKVFNCSDGACITGAEPCCSADIPAWDQDDPSDIEKNLPMFTPLQEKKNYWRLMSWMVQPS